MKLALTSLKKKLLFIVKNYLWVSEILIMSMFKIYKDAIYANSPCVKS